jgi:hypothetical protein
MSSSKADDYKKQAEKKVSTRSIAVEDETRFLLLADDREIC